MRGWELSDIIRDMDLLLPFIFVQAFLQTQDWWQDIYDSGAQHHPITYKKFSTLVPGHLSQPTLPLSEC
jgi:hypothetical protein